MSKIIVTGCGTDVGKTIVSAIITKALDGEYWKPIQCGAIKNSDTQTVKNLIDLPDDRVHLPAYDFRTPCSPHKAAKIENRKIEPCSIWPPRTKRSLVIETVGGVFVPLSFEMTTLDLLQNWQACWVVVSRHYVGSINHTLLTLAALKARKIDVRLLIFNGKACPESVEAICHFSKIHSYLELLPEKKFTKQMITEIALQWKKKLCSL